MKIKNNLLLCLIALLGLTSCYYDVEERLYPGGVCDTKNATLSGKVKPILQSRCYVCHSTQNAPAAGAGIDLESYTGLKTMVDNGKLVKAINHEAGVSPMPKGFSTKIDACEIKIIETWVAAGGLNN